MQLSTMINGLATTKSHTPATMSKNSNQLLCPSAISPNGSYYSVSTHDGQLHIWDTKTSALVADYTPTAHLSATCVRLVWPSSSINRSSILSNSPNKRRKRHKQSNEQDVTNEVERLGLIAIGTANGSVMLFSTKKNELHSQLTSKNGDGHCAQVNDIAWYPQTDSIFTCSNDKYVIEWSITKSSIKSKHMMDRSLPITSLCIINEQRLVTASNSIKLWNWNTKQLLMTYNGHSNEVQLLRPLLFGSFEDGYDILLSSAYSDRYINAWELKETEPNTNSIATFAMDDQPINMELSYTTINNIVYILSISRTGYLYIFEHQFNTNNEFFETSSSPSKLNGTPNKKRQTNQSGSTPIVPKIRLEINSSAFNMNNNFIEFRNSAVKMPSHQLPFLCVHLNANLSTSNDKMNGHNQAMLMIGYGNVNRPTFESITYSECESYHKNGGIMERADTTRDQMKPIMITDDAISNTKIRSNHYRNNKELDSTTIIGPAGFVPTQPLFNNFGQEKNGSQLNGDENSGDDEEEKHNPETNNNNYFEGDEIVKTKRTKSIKKMTLGERLVEVTEKEQQRQVEAKQMRKRSRHSESTMMEQANTDSLVNVLIQGLSSKDVTMLKTVIECKDEQIILNTIKKLPVNFVPMLVAELQRGLFRNDDHQTTYLKWINLVLKTKIKYLMTVSDISKEFLSLNQLLMARTAILDRCYQLKGRLDIMMSQMKPQKYTRLLTKIEPQLKYESDSSESDIEIDEDEEADDVSSVDHKDLMNDNTDDDDDNDEVDEEEEGGDEEMYESGVDNCSADADEESDGDYENFDD